MNEQPQQIADDIERLRNEIDLLSQRLMTGGMWREDACSKLNDYLEVLSALRQRVLSLPNEQLQPQENITNES